MSKTKEKKDTVEKDFLSYPDTAADVINVLLYQGDRVTTAGRLLAGPTETVYQGREKPPQYLAAVQKEEAFGKGMEVY
jgi:hypothetical protein